MLWNMAEGECKHGAHQYPSLEGISVGPSMSVKCLPLRLTLSDKQISLYNKVWARFSQLPLHWVLEWVSLHVNCFFVCYNLVGPLNTSLIGFQS